jgi:hypothetical protein
VIDDANFDRNEADAGAMAALAARNLGRRNRSRRLSGGLIFLPAARVGWLLEPPHENENDKDDYDDSDQPYAAMTVSVPIAAQTPTEPAEQEDYENDNENEAERHAGVLMRSSC